MKESLSVIISVHNAQATLARQIAELLDVLPELTTDYELLIFDNGSQDSTEEIACDLGLCYPQVRHIRHEYRMNSEKALQAAMSHTRGEMVIYFDDLTAGSADALHLLWQHRRSEEIMQIEPRSHGAKKSLTWIEKLLEWGRSLRDFQATQHGLGRTKVIRRSANTSGLAMVGSSPEGNYSRTDHHSAGLSTSAKPNFLEQVKHFTLNE